MKSFFWFCLGVAVYWFIYTYGGVRSICNDGSLSQSLGRGACSWHGGVKYDVKDIYEVPMSVFETNTVIKAPD